MANDTAKLHDFMEHINRIVRDSFAAFGGAGFQSFTSNTRRDTGMNLQKTALAFAEEYSKTDFDPKRLDTLASETEGLILAGNSIGVLSESDIDSLIRELYDIKENR